MELKHNTLKRLLALIAVLMTICLFSVTAYAGDSGSTLTPGKTISLKNKGKSSKTYRFVIKVKSKGTLTFSSSSYSAKGKYKLLTSKKKTSSSGNLSALMSKSLDVKKGTYHLELRLAKNQYVKKLKYAFESEKGKASADTATVFPEIVTINGTKHSTDEKELQFSCLEMTDDEIRVITKFKYLEKLNLNYLKDLSVVKEMTNIKYLRIFDPSCLGLKNTKYLKNFTKLKELYLLQTKISDLSPIKNMKELELLSFHEEFCISDLSPIKGLKKLKVLIMSYCDEISDLSPLAELSALEKLNISYTAVTDISPLYGNESLKQISLEGLEDRLDVNDTIQVLLSLKNLERVMVDTSTEFGMEIERALPNCNVSEYDFFDSWKL